MLGMDLWPVDVPERPRPKVVRHRRLWVTHIPTGTWVTVTRRDLRYAQAGSLTTWVRRPSGLKIKAVPYELAGIEHLLAYGPWRGVA